MIGSFAKFFAGVFVGIAISLFWLRKDIFQVIDLSGCQVPGDDMPPEAMIGQLYFPEPPNKFKHHKE